MSFDPNKPVSLEEYNATLRGTVNAYYEHAINDPSMSKEDAIKSTAEMSEKYLDEVQEFQTLQGMQSNTGMGTNEGIQTVESNGIQADTNTADVTGVSAADTGAADSGVSGGGIADDSTGGIGNDGSGGGLDSDGDGIDDGMDI